MTGPFTVNLDHAEMVTLLHALRYRFDFNESTRRSKLQRDITNAWRPDGMALHGRLVGMFTDELGEFAASQEADQ